MKSPWRKSSYSQPNGANCVEARLDSTTEAVDLGDSKLRAIGREEFLTVSRVEWSGFLATLSR